MGKSFTTIRVRNESAEYLKQKSDEMSVTVAEIVSQMIIADKNKDVPSPTEIRLARLERLLRINMSIYTDILHKHNINVDIPPDDIMSSLEL